MLPVLGSRVLFSLVCLLAGSLAGCASPPLALPHPQSAKPCDDCLPGVVNFSRVSDVLWRGAQPDASGFRSLATAGVTTVINLRMGDDNSDAPMASGTGLRIVQIPMKAWRPDPEQLLVFLREVEAAKRRGEVIYVHCQQGRDRTGYAVATYRMVLQGWKAPQAITEMFDFRFNRIWRSNPGFLERLDVDAMRARLSASTASLP